MSLIQAVAITLFIAGTGLVGAALAGAFDSNKNETESIFENTPLSIETSPLVSVDKPNTKTQLPKPETAKETSKNLVMALTYTPLSYEIETENYESEFIGKKYQHYLVGTYGTSNENENWWNDSYKKYQTENSKDESNLSDEFKKTNINKGFSKKDDSDNKSLNKVCEKIYKSKDLQNKREENLWKYCSSLKDVPKTILKAQKDSQYAQSTIGNSKKDVLLAVKDGSNFDLWQIKNEVFKTLEIQDSDFFKQLQEKVKEIGSNLSLKDGCEKSYSLNSVDDKEEYDSKVKESSVITYCSL